MNLLPFMLSSKMDALNDFIEKCQYDKLNISNIFSISRLPDPLLRALPMLPNNWAIAFAESSDARLGVRLEVTDSF